MGIIFLDLDLRHRLDDPGFDPAQGPCPRFADHVPRPRFAGERDTAALREVMRLCGVGAELVARGHEWSRGHEWYRSDPVNVPGLAAESLIVKIGENVARLSAETIATRTCPGR
ncbi:hypothetical protein [Flexivirga caeni]|uniref:hypothetical protein n=1 Tax=Flexivirga caeni TaxID=2294115 RepID=UPI001FE5E4C4|nr:hypothetical protein [Flexivirga caeni]